MLNSEEINARLQEIKNLAASVPSGGDLEKLKTELVRLAGWVTQTLMFLGRVEDKPCRRCRDGCDGREKNA